MCDSFLQNYTETINNWSDVESDLVPTIFFFSNAGCTGTMFPSSLTTYDYSPTTYTSLAFTPKSFFIPFNYGRVKMRSSDGLTVHFYGPWIQENMATINYTDSIHDLVSHPVNRVSAMKNDWEAQDVPLMCLGRTEYIGPFPLIRYTPHAERCDYFMRVQYCIDAKLSDNVECACFRAQAKADQITKDSKIDISPICIDEVCGVGDGVKSAYKTNYMLSTGCNFTLCQQIVKNLTNSTAKNEVYCSGSFYDKDGNVTQTSDNAAAVPNKDSTDVPNYIKPKESIITYIILGVSAVMIFVIFFLFITSSKRKQFRTS